jgi:hypothetical protein
MKTSRLIVITLVLLACLVVFKTRPDKPRLSGPRGGPSFVVQVVKPRSGRPFAGASRGFHVAVARFGERRPEGSDLKGPLGVGARCS